MSMPQSKDEWAVILKLCRHIREANSGERARMLSVIEQSPRTTSSRVRTYRTVLAAWVAWWNNIGRARYGGTILPPLRITAESLKCEICQGISEADGGYCAVCGRDVGEKNFGG